VNEQDRRHGHDLVRPYIMTGGRTRPERRYLRLESLLQTAPGIDVDRLPTEQRAILRACERPQSVADVSARLGLVVSVVSIAAADLIADGMLEVHQTDPVEIELDMLLRMIERVRTL
jgi:hypothetical protein